MSKYAFPLPVFAQASQDDKWGGLALPGSGTPAISTAGLGLPGSGAPATGLPFLGSSTPATSTGNSPPGLALPTSTSTSTSSQRNTNSNAPSLSPSSTTSPQTPQTRARPQVPASRLRHVALPGTETGSGEFLPHMQKGTANAGANVAPVLTALPPSTAPEAPSTTSSMTPPLPQPLVGCVTRRTAPDLRRAATLTQAFEVADVQHGSNTAAEESQPPASQQQLFQAAAPATASTAPPASRSRGHKKRARTDDTVSNGSIGAPSPLPPTKKPKQRVEVKKYPDMAANVHQFNAESPSSLIHGLSGSQMAGTPSLQAQVPASQAVIDSSGPDLYAGTVFVPCRFPRQQEALPQSQSVPQPATQQLAHPQFFQQYHEQQQLYHPNAYQQATFYQQNAFAQQQQQQMYQHSQQLCQLNVPQQQQFTQQGTYQEQIQMQANSTVASSSSVQQPLILRQYLGPGPQLAPLPAFAVPAPMTQGGVAIHAPEGLSFGPYNRPLSSAHGLRLKVTLLFGSELERLQRAEGAEFFGNFFWEVSQEKMYVLRIEEVPEPQQDLDATGMQDASLPSAAFAHVSPAESSYSASSSQTTDFNPITPFPTPVSSVSTPDSEFELDRLAKEAGGNKNEQAFAQAAADPDPFFLNPPSSLL